MLDRTQAPPIRQVSNITLPEIEDYDLGQGGKLYLHRESNTNAFKVEILTKAGNISAKNAASVQLTLKMLAEGTKKRTGHQLSEQIDSLGSFLEISPSFDHSSVAIYGLKKHFKENLSLLSEMLYTPEFNQKSLKLLKEREINKLQMNLEKGSYLSSTNLRKTLFNGHPYGYILSIEDLESVSIDEIKALYQSSVLSFDVYLSGDIPIDAVQVIQHLFGTNIQYTTRSGLEHFQAFGESICHRDKKFVQSSIKQGKRLFNRSHPDYLKFMVSNEILGGYFGSRLMKNIREEKGYTYGVYSSLYSLKHAGYFLISTDVKGENEKETLEEISREIYTLQDQLIQESELETVKNYMCGSFINSFSSPFAAITKFKTVNTQEVEFSFYEQYIDQVLNTTAQDVLGLACKYLDPASLRTSIAGPFKEPSL
ncbi:MULTISPECIES: M16 family metallopeptidase [Roseivirga]|uniref:Peptidase M16 C-terminal domain-containing protein n=1 Tax=Roseivirga spongicola TaxID=333140 RepID=A0A150XDP7_9BACT|nr:MULTISPECIES: pitrilysin family protein [Roseivirga]KYG76869.1 hypothetical protein AWW68_19010 [Roseivirga spongicola]MBO6662322.1 insulinase family protein [Roseivirga sp.]MBO6910172.1 insulinase family protein [Roseivirga sp.]WPZ08825.1 pitrilysin family protein [Roseivirga spongicola]